MKLKKDLRCEYLLCLVACLVPSVMEVSKVKEFMVFFLSSSSDIPDIA
jgi:hypothetical protein